MRCLAWLLVLAAAEAFTPCAEAPEICQRNSGPEGAFLIDPEASVGHITPTSSEKDLIRLYGAKNVRCARIDLGEGEGYHQLAYKDFLRAREVGIELPEATPAYDTGLLEGDPPEPVALTMPEGFPLARCYRLSRAVLDADPQHAANAHLLGALGKLDEPFVPVRISECYDGYSWAKLPTIEKVHVAIGKEIGEASLGCGRLICVESLTITAHTRDGKVYSSPVCMAVTDPLKEERRWFDSARVYVTREARKRLYASDIWFHVGGYWEDGDTYDTQAMLFSNELDEFWLSIDGPNEPFRASLVESLDRFAPGWQSVSAAADGVVRVVLADGSQKTIEPARVTGLETG